MSNVNLYGHHALRRTSPKGPGQTFIGTCTRCGREGLSLLDMQKQECANPANLTDSDSLIHAIKDRT